MRGPTLPFAPMKTYGPIFVNLREKLELLSIEILFLSPLTPTLRLDFPFYFFLFFFNLDTWLTLRLVSISYLGLFLPRKNLFLFSSIYFK